MLTLHCTDLIAANSSIHIYSARIVVYPARFEVSEYLLICTLFILVVELACADFTYGQLLIHINSIVTFVYNIVGFGVLICMYLCLNSFSRI